MIGLKIWAVKKFPETFRIWHFYWQDDVRMGGAVPAGGRMMPGLPRPDRPKSSSWKNHSRSGRMIPGLSAQDDGQDDAKNRSKLFKKFGNQTFFENCPTLSKAWQVLVKCLAVGPRMTAGLPSDGQKSTIWEPGVRQLPFRVWGQGPMPGWRQDIS